MELTTTAGEVFTVHLHGPKNARKGLIILHDWWGVLEYNHKWAERFVERNGYRTMVVDLYNGHHPADPKEAGEYMRNIDQKAVNRKLETALRSLQAEGERKIGVLGWSFGGLQAQHLVLQHSAEISAAVLFYCRIIFSRTNVTEITTPVLSIFAEMERTWPDKQANLEHIMSELDKPVECQSYDADHGFANPESLKYDSDACEDSWRLSSEFLERHLS